MRKVMLFAAGILIVASTAFAERVPMWRKMFEQKGMTYYKNEGSLKFYSKQWEFGLKRTKPKLGVYENYSLSGIAQCKRSEEGMWLRVIRATECYDGYCHKVKDDDWEEHASDTIGFYVCEIALPKCRKISDKNCTIYDP